MEPFNTNHLLDFELDYELAIRNVVTTRTVNERRKILTKLLRKEKDNPGSKICLDTYVFDFNFEEEEINKSILSITDVIIDFEGTVTDSAYGRVRSRINHLTGRISRIQIPDGEDKDNVTLFKNESYATCLKLESDLDDKVITEPDTPNNLSFLPTPVSPIVNVSPVVTCTANKQPISTWGVKFNGDHKRLFYFLERVSDLSKSRDVSEVELFNSAVELFVGDAFIWYRSIKNT
ncbi:hypothetical protein PV325_013837, partial [Microctonus aethiopoides]